MNGTGLQDGCARAALWFIQFFYYYVLTESVFCLLWPNNKPPQLFIIQLNNFFFFFFFNFLPSVPPSVLVWVSPNTLCYWSTQWQLSLSVSTEHGFFNLSSFLLVFTNTPLLLVDTHTHTRTVYTHECTPMSIPCLVPYKIWLLKASLLFLLRGTRSGLMKSDLNTSLWFKVTTPASVSTWPLILPSHNT